MAQFSIRGLGGLEAALERLGRIHEIAPKMLEEAAPILEKEVIRQATPHWVSGDMVKSIKRTKVRSGKTGGYSICVRPTGKDRKGIRNMEKAAWMEFGAKGRPAVPIITTAVLNATPEVMEKMREVFNREVSG